MSTTLELTGRDLDISGIEGVALVSRKVAISEPARETMQHGRAIVDRYVDEGIPAYGLNTGLGSRSTQTLAADEIAQFSYRLVRARAQALGEPLSPTEVRAIMLVRLNTLLTGAAGASPHLADFLIEALNRNLIAAMPRTGSVGAGDLVVMAALPHALIGEGDMLVDGTRVPAADVFERENIQPLKLGPKDGLVLCNSTALSVALASLAAGAARRALNALQVAAALSFEGFRSNTTPILEAVCDLRPQAGQCEAAAQLRLLLEGGLLLKDGAARRLQDPLSFRCVTQVNGSAIAQLRALEDALLVHLNSSEDNPAVLVEQQRIVSTGNFHVPHLTVMLDSTALALTWAATDSVSRVQRLMNEKVSGLPPLLSSSHSGRAGFSPMMKTMEALRGEIVHMATPTPAMPSFNADGIEDSLTFAPQAARKLSDQVNRLHLVVALELIAAAQAVDLARPERIAPRLAKVHRAVRGLCPFIDDDRPVGRQVEAVAEHLVASGRLAEITGLQA